MAYRMIFMGSDPIALPVLEAVYEGRGGEVELMAVYTQPDRARGRGKKVQPNEIKLWAQESGIPVRQPERMTKTERMEIEAMGVDSILVMAYGHILSQRLIDAPRYGIWNLHTSLLPRYRGASPIQCAVASGDAETGVSLMQMVREMDAGPVLDVERVCIEVLDTALEVEAKLSQACAPLVIRNLARIHSGEISVTEQDSSQASYVRKLGKDDAEIDFRVGAREVACRINGLFPWPGTRVWCGDVALKVGLAAWSEATCEVEAGTVIGLEEQGLKVACGQGVVWLKRLQRPGGKMLDAAEFVRGFEVGAGTVFKSLPMSELVTSSPVRG